MTPRDEGREPNKSIPEPRYFNADAIRDLEDVKAILKCMDLTLWRSAIDKLHRQGRDHLIGDLR